MQSLLLHRASALILGLFLLLCDSGTRAAENYPSFLPTQYQRYFVRYVDGRTLTEQMLNRINMTVKDYGRGFALIAGISKYPNLKGNGADLAPAAEDIRKLVNYLTTYEKFEEIVVLKDSDVTEANLGFFLERYFPARLRQFPRSRFLFAYSGHGITKSNNGYILTTESRDFEDTFNSIPMATMRAMLQQTVNSGFHVLALINACYGGDFLLSFGDKRFIPKYPGAHVITAGGANELTWHDPTIGSGSVFFESFFSALDGGASKAEIVTVGELSAYLTKQVQFATDQNQNPRPGDLIRGGSAGGFFFFNRSPLVEQGVLPPWDGNRGVPFGEPNQNAGELAAGQTPRNPRDGKDSALPQAMSLTTPPANPSAPASVQPPTRKPELSGADIRRQAPPLFGIKGRTAKTPDVGELKLPPTQPTMSRFWGFRVAANGEEPQKLMKVSVFSQSERLTASVLYELRESSSPRLSFAQYGEIDSAVTHVMNVGAQISFGGNASCHVLQIVTLSYEIHHLSEDGKGDVIGNVPESGCMDGKNQDQVSALQDASVRKAVQKITANASQLLYRSEVKP
jgi:hypothetical protein